MQLDLLPELNYRKPQQERWIFLWLDVGQVVLSLVLVSTGRARNLASKLGQFNQLKVQSYQVNSPTLVCKSQAYVIW
jgi:hypothetical protein